MSVSFDPNGGIEGEVNQIANLRIDREHIKAVVKRFARFVDNFEEEKIENLELRLRVIESTVLKEFLDVQRRLEILDQGELESDERELFENIYYESTGKAIKVIRRHYENKQTSDNLSNSRQEKPVIANQTVGVPRFSSQGQGTRGFPAIELIKFYGEYEKWTQFRDLYKALIHDDDSIDKVKKFYYLLSSLGGSAARLLESLEITEQNYDLAWNLLLERYEDKCLTIKNHVKALFDLPTVSRDKYTLRELLDDFNKRFRALRLLGEPVESWSTLLIYLITSKLEQRLVIQWEEFIISEKIKKPDLEQLLQFLSNKSKLQETTESRHKGEKPHEVKTSHFEKRVNFQGRRHGYAVQHNGGSMQCIICNANHHIYHCKKFTDLSLSAKIEKVKQLRLCLNCLRSNHLVSSCIAQGCRLCGKKHNTLLHQDQVPPPGGLEPDTRSEPNQTLTAYSAFHCQGVESEPLLPTAMVVIADGNGKWHQCRALLDCASQSNFITHRLTSRLGIQLTKTNVPLFGIGSAAQNVSFLTSTDIKSFNNQYKTNVNFLVIDKITGRLPSQSFQESVLKLPNINLADSDFNISSEVDILLGVSIFYQSLLPQKRELGKNMPILQETYFGWVVTGLISANFSLNPVNCNLVVSNLEKQLKQFWLVDEYPTRKFYSQQENECETIFSETVGRDIDGRFIVTLPVRKNYECVLGESLDSAVIRLKAMER